MVMGQNIVDLAGACLQDAKSLSTEYYCNVQPFDAILPKLSILLKSPHNLL